MHRQTSLTKVLRKVWTQCDKGRLSSRSWCRKASRAGLAAVRTEGDCAADVNAFRAETCCSQSESRLWKVARTKGGKGDANEGGE